MDDHVVNTLAQLEEWAKNLQGHLSSKTITNIQDIVLDAFFRKDIELLNYLNDRLSLVRSAINGRRLENVFIMWNHVWIDTITNMVKGFVFTVTQGDVFSAVKLINNGERVLRAIQEKGDAGISSYSLLKSFRGTDLDDAIGLEKSLGALIEIGCIKRVDEYLFILLRGKRFFHKEETIN